VVLCASGDVVNLAGPATLNQVDHDKLMPLAKSATKDAKQMGASFSDTDQIKAEVHTWLAWQREPGLPFGTAVNATLLDPNSRKCQPFLNWLGTLFNFPILVK
jgi:hypothetical protein